MKSFEDVELVVARLEEDWQGRTARAKLELWSFRMVRASAKPSRDGFVVRCLSSCRRFCCLPSHISCSTLTSQFTFYLFATIIKNPSD